MAEAGAPVEGIGSGQLEGTRRDSIGELYINKRWTDPVHGCIELHPLLVKIIDTPQFQRLRGIKQLGGANRVFIGATHSRFEHSIGVCYLAGELVQHLKNSQPSLRISDQQILSVKIAGLCHDLGQGPFSRLFDLYVIPSIFPDNAKQYSPKKLCHQMFNELMEKNSLEPEFKRQGLDVKFIRRLLSQQDPPQTTKDQGDQSFLYQIVSSETGVDVDRFDYIARDCHHLGIRNGFDHQRLIKSARVIQSKICFRDEDVSAIYSMFLKRYDLYKDVYWNLSTMNIQLMIAEALKEAREHLPYGVNGGEFKISDAVSQMESYTKLTDRLYYDILWSSNKDLEKARKILERLECRQLFDIVGKTVSTRESQQCEQLLKLSETDITKKITDLASQSNGKTTLVEQDLIVQKVKFGFGTQSIVDPLEKVFCYKKDDEHQAIAISKLSHLTALNSNSLSETSVRVFCKEMDDDKLIAAKNAFQSWCKVNDLKYEPPSTGTPNIRAQQAK